MIDPNEQLNELLFTEVEKEKPQVNGDNVYLSPPSSTHNVQDLDLCQWQVSPNGVFRPAAKTIASLEAGAYSTGQDDFGPFLKKKTLMSDDIIELPDSTNIQVLKNIQKFWASKDKYERHGLIFKRGVFLWGPPGGGKTTTCNLLTKDLIDNNGIVVFCGNPKELVLLISAIRKIELERPLIVVFEDIDETISTYGEHTILSLLDGENQISNVVYIASSNYPERLGARIINRPSRFDERIYVGMPSMLARSTYLKKASSSIDILDERTVQGWAEKTEGLSIAHLRELIAAVLCLEQPFEEVLKRLKSMCERPKDVEGFSRRKLGFNESN